MKKTIKITLRKKDIEKASDFGDNNNCPLAKALKKKLNIKNINVYLRDFDFDYKNTQIVGKLSNGFYLEDYRALKNGNIDKFETTATIL